MVYLLFNVLKKWIKEIRKLDIHGYHNLAECVCFNAASEYAMDDAYRTMNLNKQKMDLLSQQSILSILVRRCMHSSG